MQLAGFIIDYHAQAFLGWVGNHGARFKLTAIIPWHRCDTTF